MKNLYEVLNINKNSSEKEVRERYFSLVKKYSPEKNPKKFMEIREAYDILNNFEKRKDYDSKLQEELKKQYGQIEKLEKEADELSSNVEYDKAIKIYKEILRIDCSLENIESKLATILIKNNELKEAEEILKKLLNANDKLEYNKSLAEINYLRKDYESAEKYILKIKSLKNENKDIILGLADIYAENGEYIKLENTIYEFLGKYENNFRIFTYSLILINNYIYKENEYKIQRLLRKNLSKVDEKSNIKEYVIKESIKLAYKLYFENMSNAFIIISENIRRLGNKKLEGILFIEGNNDLNKKNELFKLIEDRNVIDVLKEPIIFNFIRYKEEIFKRRKVENISEIKNYAINEPDRVLNSVRILREKYSNLYYMIDKIYISIENIANNSIEYEKENFGSKLKNEENTDSNNFDFDELKIKLEENVGKLKDNLSKSLEKGKEKLANGKESFAIEMEKKIDVMKNKSIYEMVSDISPNFMNKMEGFIKKNRK